LRSHGMSTLSWDRQRGCTEAYGVSLHGFNYRMDDLRAALGREQLRKLPHGNGRRAELTELYRHRLAELADWIIPFEDGLTPSANHLMPLLAPDAETRSHVVSALKSQGIQSSFHYPNIASFAAFAEYADSDVPKSAAFATRVITLPLHPLLSNEDVETVCAVLLAASKAPK
jgi:dTDP-4-amino-4,6-dideoxygalactose transaminase